MVTKAIIEQINSPYEVVVRIPLFNSISTFSQSTKANNLNSAIICTLPQCNFIPTVGDIVFVAFEDNDIGRPVVIGCLFKESGNTSGINLNVRELIVNGNTYLSEDTQIGDVTSDEIKQLKNLKFALEDLQSQIDSIRNGGN